MTILHILSTIYQNKIGKLMSHVKMKVSNYLSFYFFVFFMSAFLTSNVCQPAPFKTDHLSFFLLRLKSLIDVVNFTWHCTWSYYLLFILSFKSNNVRLRFSFLTRTYFLFLISEIKKRKNNKSTLHVRKNNL